MVENATKFNRKGSPVYKDAVQLMDRFETLLAESEVKFLEEEKLETHENKLSEIEWNGITYKIGDYCYFEAGGDQRLVGCLFDMWQDESGRKGVTVHMYVFPEMTHHKFQTKFYQKEVLKRTRPEHRFVESILGRCHVLHVKDYVRGKPVGADMNDVYVCENRYNDQTRTISKIKNWAICVPEQVRTQDLILDLYDQPLHLQKAPLASELGEQPPYKRRKDSEDFDSPLQKRRATLTRDQAGSPLIRNASKVGPPQKAAFFLPRPLNGTEKFSESVIQSFDRQGDGVLRWYATPPLDIITPEQPQHSLEYLKWKSQNPHIKQEPVEEMQIDSPVKRKEKQPLDESVLLRHLKNLNESLKRDVHLLK